MGISVIAKYKEINLSNLKNILKIYPYLIKDVKWKDVKLKIEDNSMIAEYREVISLLSSQLGIENRGNKYFEVNNYLFLLNNTDLLNYLRYWTLTYYVPNPYTENDRKPILIWVDICEKILKSEKLEIDYYRYFKEQINSDVRIKRPNNRFGEITLKKLLIDYSIFLKVKKDKRTIYIRQEDKEQLIKTIVYLKKNFRIPKIYMDKDNYFKRYSINNFKKLFNKEIMSKNFKNLKVDFEKKFVLKELIVEEKQRLEHMINSNLKAGKHLILYGDIGVGKTKIAKEICEEYGVDYQLTTANSEWAIYETIGGYKLEKDSSMRFDEGTVLSCFKDRENEVKNKWLIIDEINRADIDRAFSPLFSVLSGDDTVLNFKGENNEFIKLINEKNIELEEVNSNVYVIPKDWRIIATMNTTDKDSLYDMSYAFMRRFALIPILNLEKITEELVEELLNIWKIDSDYKLLAKVWRKINKYKKIGPAIIKDLAKYIEDGEDIQEGIIVHILPQFQNEEELFKSFIKEIDIKKDYIEKVMKALNY